MRLLLFILIEIVLTPFLLLGVLGYTVRLRLLNIPKGISGTAYEPFWARLMLHDAGVRPDEAASRIARHLPAISRLVEWLVVGPLGIGAKLSGYRGSLYLWPATAARSLLESALTFMNLRTQFFDHELGDATDSDRGRGGEPRIRQVVILGSGWDTRAYGLLADRDVRVFEVDRPPTLSAKREAVGRAGLDAGHVTFVETEFNQRKWIDALVESGFDVSQPAFILWEGVTMYLGEEAVNETLGHFANLAHGSLLAFDYFSGELIHAQPPFGWIGPAMRFSLKLYYSEDLHFGISTRAPAREPMARLLAEHGLELDRHQLTGEERVGRVTLGGLALVARSDRDGGT